MIAKILASLGKKRLFKKLSIYGLCFFVCFSILPETAYADTGDFDFMDGLAQLASSVVKYLLMFTWIILAFIGKLMDNQYIVGDTGGIQLTLYQIWLVVRNLVNVGFVFLLLGAAFYMVIGGGGEGGIDFKSKLPKFVLALVLVNFSWLGCRVVLDFANVLTSAAFAIPQSIQIEDPNCKVTVPESTVQGGQQTFATVNGCYVISCVDIGSKDTNACKPAASQNVQLPPQNGGGTNFNIDNVDFENLQAFENNQNQAGTFDTQFGDDIIHVTTKDNFFSYNLKKVPNGIRELKPGNAAMIMAMNLTAIQNLPLIASEVNSTKDLTINIIFSLVLSLIIIVPFLIMLVVLIGRMVMLWLSIAFMPIAFIGWVIKGDFTGAIVDGMPNVVEEFINAAFIPVYLALPISIGFLMINAGAAATLAQAGTEPIINIGSAVPGLSDIHQLLWHLATAAVIWKGVDVATEKGPDITKGIATSIADTTKGWGKWLATAPIKYTPLIPISTGPGGKPEPYSLASVLQLPEELKARRRSESSQGANKLANILSGIDPNAGTARNATSSSVLTNKDIRNIANTTNGGKATKDGKNLNTNLRQLSNNPNTLPTSTELSRTRDLIKRTLLDAKSTKKWGDIKTSAAVQDIARASLNRTQYDNLVKRDRNEGHDGFKFYKLLDPKYHSAEKAAWNKSVNITANTAKQDLKNLYQIDVEDKDVTNPNIVSNIEKIHKGATPDSEKIDAIQNQVDLAKAIEKMKTKVSTTSKNLDELGKETDKSEIAQIVALAEKSKAEIVKTLKGSLKSKGFTDAVAK